MWVYKHEFSFKEETLEKENHLDLMLCLGTWLSIAFSEHNMRDELQNVKDPLC